MAFPCPKDRRMLEGLRWQRNCEHWIPLAKYGHCELMAVEKAPLTLREIAKIMGISAERVRQIEKDALQKLRDALAAMDTLRN